MIWSTTRGLTAQDESGHVQAAKTLNESVRVMCEKRDGNSADALIAQGLMVMFARSCSAHVWGPV